MTIIQNKLDIANNREMKNRHMEIDFLEDFAKNNGFDCFFQTSAKTGENVDFAISTFLKIVIDKYENFYRFNINIELDGLTSTNIRLDDKINPTDKSSCC